MHFSNSVDIGFVLLVVICALLRIGDSPHYWSNKEPYHSRTRAMSSTDRKIQVVNKTNHCSTAIKGIAQKVGPNALFRMSVIAADTWSQHQ
jgi:hypothetical protein